MNDKSFVVLWLLGVFFITLLVILALPLFVDVAVNTGVSIGREI